MSACSYFDLYAANGESKFSTSEIEVIDFGVDDKEDQVSSNNDFVSRC